MYIVRFTMQKVHYTLHIHYAIIQCIMSLFGKENLDKRVIKFEFHVDKLYLYDGEIKMISQTQCILSKSYISSLVELEKDLIVLSTN